VNKQRTSLTLVLAAAAALGLSAKANWPQFRGLHGGVAEDDPSLPDGWGPTENIVWRIDVPGRAWSSPIISGDHIFITSVVNTTGVETPLKPLSQYQSRSFDGPMTGRDLETPSAPLRWVLYDIDFATRAVRWERTLHTATPGSKHEKNSYASETAVTDGERVYVYLGYVGLFAFDMDGTALWSVPMELVKMRDGWGAAASPVVHGGRLYIVNDNQERSFVAAYDTETGREVWKVGRVEVSNWSTPFIWENAIRTEIVTTGTGGVRSYDLEGRYLWGLSGMSSIHVPTPFARHGLLYINSGYTADSNRPVYAIRPGASGDITLAAGASSNEYIVWSHPTLGSYNPSALVYGDYHYTLLDRGILICHDARTGKEVYPRRRVAPGGSLFTASPWAYNGRIFAISEEGDTYVVKAGPEFELLGVNSLNEWTLATPAIAHGSLIVRTVSRLYRIAKR
jgi:hypothetical protein